MDPARRAGASLACVVSRNGQHPVVRWSPEQARTLERKCKITLQSANLKLFRNFPLILGRRFAAALLPRLFGKNPRSHHKGVTWEGVGFELETNGFQLYAIANLDKTSLLTFCTFVY